MFFKTKYVFSIFVIVFVNYSFFTPIQAQTIRFNAPKPQRQRDKMSGRQKGGASRGNCPAVTKPLTALVPAKWKQSGEKPGQDIDLKPGVIPDINSWQSVWGQTVLESPTLWFYVPYTSKQPLLFVLETEQGNTTYKTYLNTTQLQPGVVKVALPSTVKLDLGKLYHWFFVVDCDPNSYSYVEGWIQRVALNPALNSQLKVASPQRRVALYAANGIWYDALTTLAQLRSTNLEDSQLHSEWVYLLKSVGLSSVASEPILDCCTPQQSTANQLQPVTY